MSNLKLQFLYMTLYINCEGKAKKYFKFFKNIKEISC